MMISIERALSATRESKHIEFKELFDVDFSQHWCEILKDLIAIANSGGGIIVIGVDNRGNPLGNDVSSISQLDPARISDKIFQYTGVHFSSFQVQDVYKNDRHIVVLTIEQTNTPIIFTKPGTYAIEGGKQRTSFSAGTVYFRHGAKSEPGNTEDLRQFLEKRLKELRKTWLSGIRKLVLSPTGSRSEVTSSKEASPITNSSIPVRLVEDPSVTPGVVMNPDQTHPYRQKEVIEEITKELPSYVTVNAFDILAVRRVYKINENKKFSYNSKFASPQYSKAFVTWIIEQYRKNPSFFSKARERFSSGEY